MTEIQGKSILVRVSARFKLARVRVIWSRLYNLRDLLYLVTTAFGLIQMIGRNHVRIKYTMLYPLVPNDDIMFKKDE